MLANLESVEPGYGQLTDEELLRRFKNGDRECLDVLIRGYLPKTYKRVYSMVPESDAEDVEQEIFLSFIKSIGKFEINTSFAAWFDRITARRIADYYRHRSRQREDLTENQPSKVDDPWKSIDEQLTLEAGLKGMPEKYRSVLLMKLSEDLSISEISERLDLTYEATRSRYRRGIKMLREKLVR